jgi:hypothetical protein
MQVQRQRQWRHGRRGTVIVQVAVMSTVIMGMAAMAIDVGSMYTVQAELQSVADAAALAAAAQLGGQGGGDPAEWSSNALEAANQVAVQNVANGQYTAIPLEDIVFGRSTYNAALNQWSFAAGGSTVDAVRVTARRAGGAALPMRFAGIFGKSVADLRAEATATLIPRDMVVIVDLSNSMGYDSELRYYNRTDGGYSNLRDIWAALDGPQPSIPYMPGSELQTEYAADTGPTYGSMTQWGDPLVPGYSVSGDPGLWRLVQKYAVTSSAVQNSLTARGYSTEEVNVLCKSYSYESNTQFENRAGVILGLADWNSGRWGGRNPSTGDGDLTIDGWEVVWRPAPPFAKTWNWKTYINYMKSSSSNSAFRQYYGLKTFTDFLLENRPEYYQTDIQWATPEQPLRAVKDAVQSMTDFIVALDTPDQLGLVVFAASSPPPEVYLTDNLPAVPARLYQMQSGHYDRTTNIGAGLARARAELKSSRARGNAKKVIVLMSDGEANVSDEGSYTPKDYAIYQAQLAADDGMMIYTVSVGYASDRPMMQEIAALGRGREFYAAGSPEEYTEELQDIFRSLGGRRPVALIE